MIDQERLEEMEADFGSDALGEIVATFIDEAGGAIEMLGAAGADARVRRDRLHFIKGCARMIGARRLGDLCAELEDQPRLAAEDVERLEREFRALRITLRRKYPHEAG